ncbi:MAG: OsmC family protein [Acidobacteriaceae bacterium]|nr:OsmC family protein [Acidobacteriaceae bacterium]
MASTQEISTIINGVVIDSLFSTIDAVKTSSSIAKFKFRIRNQWETGSCNRSTVQTFTGANQELSHPRPFVLEADEPAILLGKDLAANPVEYLLHALASCLTTSMVYHAASRGIHINEIESSFEGDIDLHGFLDLDQSARKGFQEIRGRFKIDADVSDEQLQELMELGTGHSPVFDSLTNGVPVKVTAERR